MGKVAFVFPGQGAQKVGMASDFRLPGSAGRLLYDRAAETLGWDLAALCDDGPEEALRQTIHTQPALYVASCAAVEEFRLRAPQVRPHAMAGHSVGEYAALYAAGAMDFHVGLKLVARRAALMRDAAEARPGAMAAVIGLAAEAVAEACAEASEAGIVAVANTNCPGQVVVSGEEAAVERASAAARARGARMVTRLQVSGGFHSPLMAAAGDALYPELREAGFRPADVPVVVNVEAAYCSNGIDVAPFLTMQVSGGVRWEESMRLLLADGCDTFVELGCGNVLSGLMKRIDRGARSLVVEDAASLDAACAALASAG
ncbi:MAG: ACP S-malonyltransferase [Armatimonadetes bacterium]|nr:ACP S-malonyltransferase [Armatimonadota bacterium]